MGKGKVDIVSHFVNQDSVPNKNGWLHGARRDGIPIRKGRSEGKHHHQKKDETLIIPPAFNKPFFHLIDLQNTARKHIAHSGITHSYYKFGFQLNCVIVQATQKIGSLNSGLSTTIVPSQQKTIPHYHPRSYDQAP